MIAPLDARPKLTAISLVMAVWYNAVISRLLFVALLMSEGAANKSLLTLVKHIALVLLTAPRRYCAGTYATAKACIQVKKC